MAALPHRRQVFLFLVAVLFPSAVLVALGLRIIGQERELAEKRLADDRRRLVAELRQAILAELEAIKVDELRRWGRGQAAPSGPTYRHPAVELVSPVADGKVVLPWESDDRLKRARTSLSRPAFSRAIARGERAELAGQDVGVAIDGYREAVRSAEDPLQAAYGRLLLARALKRAGRSREATQIYRSLLETPSDVVDDHGVPVALYAAASLLEARLDHDRVQRRVRAEIASPWWHAPPTAYMLRDLLRAGEGRATASARRADTSAASERLEGAITRIERAATLQREFAALGLSYGSGRSSSAPSPWVPFADGAWLVTVAPVPGTVSEALVAVDANRFLETASLAALTTSQPAVPFALRVGGDAPGEPLGPSLPGLRVSFTGAPEEALARVVGLQRSLSLVVLLLVLSVTLFGGYLLWRDVRRETRLAELRSHFVSSVSHELKTPLTAIRMFAETLRARDSAGPSMQREYLDTIVGESERLTRLLNNVLDHSKIEQDQKIYRRESTALDDIVHRAASAMEYPLTQGDFTLRLEIENGLPPVSVDADAVEQAILNLLTNAMKYSGDSRDIDLRVRLANGHAVIEVCDRGVGIPEPEQALITEKFYRVRSPENDRIPGTGLGLTLVEHMVRAHGGRLEVQSVVGQGSTFSIHLPLGAES